MTVLAPPLDRISLQACPYPADALPVGGTALALFAAAFLGTNDVIHFARKDMTATCVDRDLDRLAEMALLYPAYWDFKCDDAWKFAETNAKLGNLWDVVSVDTYTGNATTRSLASLDLWCSLARRMVTATIVAGTEHQVPEGWRSYQYPRSTRNKVNWLVLQRD